MQNRLTLRSLALLLLLFALVRTVDGYAFEGLSSWPAGSKIVVRLGLGPSSGPLQDGFASWNASAADAVDIWNGYLGLISISSVSAPTAPGIPGDGIISTYFGSDIFGEDFGVDTLAVTITFEGLDQADVIVNQAFHFDSYRGPQQAGAYDLHRVLLHEFGHLLGLDHVTFKPAGQAIMEPIISDLDHLGPDDIAGVQYLYGAKLDNPPDPVFLRVGQTFTSPAVYGSNRPTSFSAAYLPPGLTIDSATGALSGTVTAGGSYGTVITGHGPFADAYETVSFTVIGLDQLPGLVAILPQDVFYVLGDPIRPRIYTTSIDGLKMVDSDSFKVTTLLAGDQRGQLSMSADGSTLLLVTQVPPLVLKKIDTTSLKVVSSFPIPDSISAALEGLDGRYYFTSQGSVLQLDASNGAVEQTIAMGDGERGIAISPDRQTLFVTGAGSLQTYDISTPDPASLSTLAGNYFAPAVAPDNAHLYLTEVTTGGAGKLAKVSLPSLTPAVSFGLAQAGVANDGVVPSGDTIYQTHIGNGYSSGEIFFYDPITLKQTADLKLGSMSPIYGPFRPLYDPLFGAALDHEGKYLFVPINGAELWVFSTDPASFPPAPAKPEKNLLNISTRVRVDSGEKAMIGGFIVAGDTPKKVLIRGLGPSLPLTGAIEDPVIELHDSTGKIISTNDNWIAQRLAILSTGIPPTSEREAAIVTTLDPGSYTAIVTDARGQPGPSLVEVYDLDAQNSAVANISTRGEVGTGSDVMIGGFIIGGDQPGASPGARPWSIPGRGRNCFTIGRSRSRDT